MTEQGERVRAALPAYDIGAEVGRGGCGVVLAGTHRRLRRPVAIKQIPPQFANDDQVRRRFIAEAQVLAAIDHPHVVRVFDYLEHGDLCLLVMEYLPGGTVGERFATDGYDSATAVAIALACAAGLEAAHRHHILHRDVKPANLMFAAGGAIKLTDFGIAKIVGGDETLMTKAGDIIGTPSYIAPEQARGQQLSPATDVYALATMLYQLLSGVLPFPPGDGPLAMLFAHAFDDPIPLTEVAPNIPEPIAAVVMRGLATNPDHRFPTAEAFGIALAQPAAHCWGQNWLPPVGIPVIGADTIVAAATGATPSRHAPHPSYTPQPGRVVHPGRPVHPGSSSVSGPTPQPGPLFQTAPTPQPGPPFHAAPTFPDAGTRPPPSDLLPPAAYQTPPPFRPVQPGPPREQGHRPPPADETVTFPPGPAQDVTPAKPVVPRPPGDETSSATEVFGPPRPTEPPALRKPPESSGSSPSSAPDRSPEEASPPFDAAPPTTQWGPAGPAPEGQATPPPFGPALPSVPPSATGRTSTGPSRPSAVVPPGSRMAPPTAPPGEGISPAPTGTEGPVEGSPPLFGPALPSVPWSAPGPPSSSTGAQRPSDATRPPASGTAPPTVQWYPGGGQPPASRMAPGPRPSGAVPSAGTGPPTSSRTRGQGAPPFHPAVTRVRPRQVIAEHGALLVEIDRRDLVPIQEVVSFSSAKVPFALAAVLAVAAVLLAVVGVGGSTISGDLAPGTVTLGGVDPATTPIEIDLTKPIPLRADGVDAQAASLRVTVLGVPLGGEIVPFVPGDQSAVLPAPVNQYVMAGTLTGELVLLRNGTAVHTQRVELRAVQRPTTTATTAGIALLALFAASYLESNMRRLRRGRGGFANTIGLAISAALLSVAVVGAVWILLARPPTVTTTAASAVLAASAGVAAALGARRIGKRRRYIRRARRRS
ncbi:protein kinase [Nocardia sp. NPDC049149]|uniref:serine/threonine-protein kinase n=1 Tax=Nocardia sp. NPDC049149 TaxID=3364315 RepID=UPI003722C546